MGAAARSTASRFTPRLIRKIVSASVRFRGWTASVEVKPGATSPFRSLS
jgi:hypothetical protein